MDTLKVNHASGAVTLGNLSAVEIVEISSAAGEGATVDSTGTTGVTDLNVIKAAGKVDLTAAGTTDVSVDIKSQAVAVQGGNDVTVMIADVDGSGDSVVVVGTTAPKGDVVVETTAKAAVNSADGITMGTIDVTGGKTISVTQKVGDASGLVAGDTATTHTQGAVTVTANAETTTVTVKQDAAATAASVKAVAKVDEVATVTFTKLDAEQSVTVGGLTFTATKDLTADQVAAAFASLSSGAVKPTNLADSPVTATGDTNGGSVVANGEFTGSLLAKWSSAAASGNTVTFTASGAMDDLTVSGTGATVVTTTQGVAAVTGKNTLGVVNGTVSIAGAAALATVTVDGYGASSAITGDTNTALETISLANGGAFNIASAATTLGLTLSNVNGTVDVAAGTKTLNVGVSHAKSTQASTLTSATAEAVNVSGTGNVAGDTTSGLAAATAINTTGMTAGKATFTIADGTKTTYTGGAGVDSVTVSNANVAITKAIDLGAGDDTLTLNVSGDTTVAVPTATLKGGDGIDTIAMSSASAAALSANGTFAGKIEGFEKLAITDKVTAATTVNLANMDGITYVVSNNAAASEAVEGSKQIYSFDIAGLVLSTDGTLEAGGVLLHTASGDEAASAIAAAVSGDSVTIGDVAYTATATGTVITLTSTANVAPQAAITVTTPDGVSGDASITNAGVTTTPGVADVTGGTPFLTLDKMANNGTLELVGSGDGVVVKMADATGLTDSFNIVTKVDGVGVSGDGGLDFGTVDVAGVETLKLNAVDKSPVDADGVATISTATLDLKADKATSLTIEGNSNVTLTLDTTTTKLATIDASTLTGKLDVGNTLNAVAMTITGGSGADTLKASVGATAKADVIDGGAGNDIITAGSNGAKLTGGAGNDLFILTAAAADSGNKESNTYSTIQDFQAGDLLQLQWFDSTDTDPDDDGVQAAGKFDVKSFAKLTASLESTAVFSDFANAAIKQASAGEAVWFNFGDSAYVVVDSGTSTDAFVNGEDLIIKLAGINGDNLSYNDTFATVALI